MIAPRRTNRACVSSAGRCLDRADALVRAARKELHSQRPLLPRRSARSVFDRDPSAGSDGRGGGAERGPRQIAGYYCARGSGEDLRTGFVDAHCRAGLYYACDLPAARRTSRRDVYFPQTALHSATERTRSF